VGVAAVAVALALLAGAPPEPEPPATPEEIVAYRESGAWERDTARVVRRARRVLLRHRGDERAAIVLDVDDTSLSSYECLKRAGFDREREGGACAQAAAMPPIPQTLALHRLARRHGVTVFFLTGRRERLRRPTLRNLRIAGYAGRRRLIMRPDRERPGEHAGFKARARRALQRRGHRVVVNLGDQRSDLRGGHALRAFKLPNPMYVVSVA
jgi:predicted secreted acid phosphatase